MRAFIMAVALGLSLTACADSAEQNAIDEGAPAGDRADVVGDGEIIDEPGEPDADVLGDGFTQYDTDTDGYLSDTEYGTNFGTVVMTDYDTDGDGRVSKAEYDAYMAAHPTM